MNVAKTHRKIGREQLRNRAFFAMLVGSNNLRTHNTIVLVASRCRPRWSGSYILITSGNRLGRPANILVLLLILPMPHIPLE